jgi:drug/metabolite transporter (DMT)-like permease
MDIAERPWSDQYRHSLLPHFMGTKIHRLGRGFDSRCHRAALYHFGGTLHAARRQNDRAKSAGLLIGFAGVVVLMSKDIGNSTSSLLGQLAVILACVFYAGSSIFARVFTEDIPATLRGLGPLVSASVVMIISAFIFEAPVKIPTLPITWVALLWMGILGSGMAFIMLFYLIHEIGPTRATMVTYLFPLGGVTLGVIFLHEALTWQVVTGAALIILSLVVANWQPKQIQ